MSSPQQPKRRQYESISEAAARVGVSIKTIRRWIASGHLVGYRMGPRLLRIDPDELDGMLTLVPTVASRGRRSR
jgi:excisionase family DNA binding protein